MSICHSTLLEPANAFLAKHPQLDVINCETVSVKLSPKCDTSNTTYVEDEQTSSHRLRILRYVHVRTCMQYVVLKCCAQILLNVVHMSVVLKY